LTAVLALSDRVEVVSSAAASEARGYVFADYASFQSEADGVPHGPTSVAFDFFRMSGHPRPVHQTFREAVNDPRSGRSVHVVYRSRHGNVVLLGGADVQWTGLMRELETDLINANALPSYRPDKDAGEADTIDDLRALLAARAGDEFQASGPSKEVPNRKESA
jgi:hypothetical protein